jgi:hypothetical protein
VVDCGGEIFGAGVCHLRAFAGDSRTPCFGRIYFGFSTVFYSSLVFLKFLQSLPMIVAYIMGLFLGLVCSDQPSLFSSGALL